MKDLLNRDDCVLVVMDVQKRLAPVISEIEMVKENIIKLIKFSQIVGIPIVVTEQEKLGDTVEEIQTLISEFNPISKITFSCYGEENFNSRIKRLNKSTLILTGIETHICVAQTAFQASDEYNVVLVNDAASSRSLHDKNSSINRLKTEGITIISTEMLIYELLERAGTAEFKKVLKLVT